MDCQVSRSEDVALVVIVGSLDSSWATYLTERFDEVVRSGAHDIRVDMSGVSYLSSNGIALLVRYHRQLRAIGGRFRIVADSAAVVHVLKATGVLKLLMDDGPHADAAALIAPAGDTLDSDGVSLRIFKSTRRPAAEGLKLIGDPARLPHRSYDETDARAWRAQPDRVAIGLGALGPCFDACRGRFGEFLAAAGVAAYRPGEGSCHPDFEQATAAFVPEVHLLYGMSFSVKDGATMVCFESQGTTGDSPVALGKLAEAALSQGEANTVGVVLIGETAGLVGTALRRSPVGIPEGGLDVFAPSQARDWLSLTSEPVHARSTALVVGVATCRPTPTLAPFVRSLSYTGQGELYGHFHAAVVPYRPLPRGALDLTPTVRLLFEPGRVENVLHLLSDSRPILGAGESSFTRGVLWVVPLTDGAETASS
jgi:anti-anti-sigma factor